MWAVISGIIQIIYLLIKNKFEKDSDSKTRKEALHEEAKEVIKSGDASQLNAFINKLRG